MIRYGFGYSRVSGKGQIEGDGPERQKVAIEAFARRFDLTIMEIALEGGVSGTTEGLERPELARLIETCRDTGGYIVVERLDRLARDLMVQEVLLAQCREFGVPVYAAENGELVDVARLDDDPTRKAFRQMAGVFAEWDKTNTVLKLRAARRRKKAREGRCEGRKPYGFNACERSVLDMMIERFADQGSYADVAWYLNNLGLKTRSGTEWNRGTVCGILRRHENEVELYKSSAQATEPNCGGEGSPEGEAAEREQGGPEYSLDGGGIEGPEDAAFGEEESGRGIGSLQQVPCQEDGAEEIGNFSGTKSDFEAVSK